MASNRVWPRTAAAFFALSFLGCGGGYAYFPDLIAPGTGGTAPPATFSRSDLAGDWVATFKPAAPDPPPYPFYLRCDPAGLPFEGGDALGRQWSTGVSVSQVRVSKKGAVVINLTTARWLIELSGRLNRAATVMRGDYALYRDGVLLESGRYVAELSSGAGQFSVAEHLAASWSGTGFNRRSRFRDILLDIGADGSVTGGEMVGEHVFLVGVANVGIFQFSNSAVGRLDNVVIECDDGETITLDYALVSSDGSYLGGPGADSELGPGFLRVFRQ